MFRRSRAREVVLQVLYEDDLNPTRDMAVSDEFLRRRLNNNADLIAFAEGVLSGVRRNRQEIDALLSERAENWRLERMAVTDRNILRLAAFEMLYTDTPDRVVINEAVELAKRFGAKQSSQFVNGILDRLFRDRGEMRSEKE
jgi:N utilization substance protein B